MWKRPVQRTGGSVGAGSAASSSSGRSAAAPRTVRSSLEEDRPQAEHAGVEIDAAPKVCHSQMDCAEAKAGVDGWKGVGHKTPANSSILPIVAVG